MFSYIRHLHTHTYSYKPDCGNLAGKLKYLPQQCRGKVLKGNTEELSCSAERNCSALIFEGY